MTHSMRLPSLIIAGMLAFLSLPAQAETIEFPEDDFWRALTQSLAGDGPDFEALAKRTPEYRAADEFARDAVLAEQVARLEARHSRVGPETEVLIRASVRLGDYDAVRGGFPVSLFAPGTYLRVGGGLRFSNGSDYAILPATPEEGREIRERERSSSLNSAILRAGDFRRDPGHANGLLATLYQFDYVDGDGGIIASMAHAPQTPSLDDEAVEALVQKTQADILAAASLPPIGSDWSSVRHALTAGYGFAVSDNGAYDDGRFRMVGGRIEEEDLDEAAEFRVGFGNDGDMVAGIFANQDFMARARLPLGEIDTNPTGRGLDCGTPHLADACGVLIFDRIEDVWKLTRAEGVIDLPGADHVAAIEAMLGDNVDAFLRSDVEIAYHPEWLRGDTGGQHFSSGHAVAARYILGEDMGGSPEYIRPTDPWQGGTINHEITLYAVDGAEDRMPLIFTLAPRDLAVPAPASADLAGHRILSGDMEGLTAYEIFEDDRFLPAIKAVIGNADIEALQRASAVSAGGFEEKDGWYVHGGCRAHVCSSEFTSVAVQASDGSVVIVHSVDGTPHVYGADADSLPPVFARHGL